MIQIAYDRVNVKLIILTPPRLVNQLAPDVFRLYEYGVDGWIDAGIENNQGFAQEWMDHVKDEPPVEAPEDYVLHKMALLAQNLIYPLFLKKICDCKQCTEGLIRDLPPVLEYLQEIHDEAVLRFDNETWSSETHEKKQGDDI